MLLTKIKTAPKTIDFKEVIAYIDEHYDFTPTKFTNGNTPMKIMVPAKFSVSHC